MSRPATIETLTFGCRLNTAESEAIAGLAAAAGLTDAVIVNTCAVTQAAEREALRAIRRLHRERPSARIVVTGCAAQIAPDRFALSGVSHVVGNADKLDPRTWSGLATRPRVAIAPFAATIGGSDRTPGFADHTRAFIEVQQGCDHRCTFCVIPQGRGPARSLPAERVLNRARAALDAGAREIVLTGVDLTAWGGDLEGAPRLGALVEILLNRLPGLARLRLSSLDPAEIDDALVACLAEPRLMPHVHLSLQAGDDLILKRMRRRHRVADAYRAAERIRQVRTDIALGADIIAGFPTEDDHAFTRTLAHVEAIDLPHLHVFPFSPRSGTPAARMPPVPAAVIKGRAARLREAGHAARRRLIARVAGMVGDVLVERGGDAGYSPHYLRVALDRPAPPGTIVAATLAVDDGTLRGVAA